MLKFIFPLILLILVKTMYWTRSYRIRFEDTSPQIFQASVQMPSNPTRILPEIQIELPQAGSNPTAKALLENWDLENTGLTEKELEPFFTESQPESIVFFDAGTLKQIFPKHPEEGERQSGEILFLGTQESIQNTIYERKNSLDLREEGAPPEKTNSHWDSPAPESRGTTEKIALEHNSFEIEFFKPGKRDSGETLQPVINNLISTLQGPDYSFENYNPKDDQLVIQNLSKVLSLGHGGELLLKVSENGFILNESGFDFSIYQTTFRIGRTKIFWHKFGFVGVSESLQPESFKWFRCDPLAKVLSGCAGAVPTTEGGDQFDLGEVGVKKARYIWIRDFGKNKNFSSKWPTEGLSVDALRLKHAYKLH